MAFQELTGQFWLASSDGPRRSGVLRIDNESAPLLTVQGALTSMMRLVEVSGEGDEAVSKYEPSVNFSSYTIHGITDDGVVVTILEAFNRKYSGGLWPDQQTEVLQGAHAVMGGTLSGRDHRFSGMRVRIQLAKEALSNPFDRSRESNTPLASGGTLRCENEGEATWFVLQGLDPRSIRGLDRHYVTPLCTLVTLATKVRVGLLELQLQENDETPWLEVYSAAHRSSDLPFPNSALLQRSDLSPSVLATWLDKVEKLGPLPAVVAAGLSGPIALEATVLAFTTAAEGLHRRLRPNELRFSEEVGAAIREAAAEAAERVKADSGKAVEGFLYHVHEVGYGARLISLADIVRPFMPEVTGRSNRWKAAVYDARNDFAHRAQEDWFEDSDYDKYVVVALSLRWLLRGILLSEAGITASVLALRFQAHAEYRLFLEQAQEWQPRIYQPEGP